MAKYLTNKIYLLITLIANALFYLLLFGIQFFSDKTDPGLPPYKPMLLNLFNAGTQVVFVLLATVFLLAGLGIIILFRRPEKKFAVIGIVINLITIFGVIYVLFFIPFGNRPLPIIEIPPGSNCEKVVLQKSLTHVVAYEETQYFVDNQNIALVEIRYGPPQDCLSGCIYNGYIGILNANGILSDFYSLPNPFYALVEKHGRVCASFDFKKDHPPYYARRIVREGDNFFWQLVFQEFDPGKFSDINKYYNEYSNLQCILNGELTFFSSSSNFFDDSYLKVKQIIPDCDTSQSVKKKAVCIIAKARVLNDTSLCKELTLRDYFYSREYCYEAIAKSSLNENLCANIENDYRQGRCYLSIAQAKRDVEICQSIPRDFERDQCVESIEQFLGIFDEI